MKKIILLLALCFGFMTSSFAQNGELMTATHNVYSGITHTYKATGTDAFTWEVFSDEGCTASIVATSGEYTFSGTSNLTKDLTITWNEPAVSPATYYLRLKQDDGCINYKTLKVVVTSVDNMTFAFATATTESCAVNISESAVIFDVILTGDYLVHATGSPAQIEYDIDGGTKAWMDVDLGSTEGAGNYTITIPAVELLSAVATTSQEFKINIYQLKDGNGAVNDFTLTPITHTWTATGLPTIVDITF